jgi:hypothetical protein
MTPTSQDSCGSTYFSNATLAPSEQSSGVSSPPVEFTLEAEMKTIIGCATYPGDSYIGGCQELHQMPRATPKVRWWAVLRPFCAYSREVLRLGPFHGAAVRMGRSRLADAVLAAAGRLFAWLTFLLLGILIALGLAAQLPEIGFFTADLI